MCKNAPIVPLILHRFSLLFSLFFVSPFQVTLKTRVPRSRDRRRLRNELKVMTDIPASPFLQRCHAAFETATRLFFVVDFNAGGDLFNHLVKDIRRLLLRIHIENERKSSHVHVIMRVYLWHESMIGRLQISLTTCIHNFERA